MIHAITIDFWNTIVDSNNGAARRRVRNAAVAAVYRQAGRPLNEEEATEAFRISYETFEKHWRGEQRTLGASECLHVMWEHLGMKVDERLHRQTVHAFEESILDGLPGLLPGARDALERLAARVPLGLISDTAFSPGRVLRRVLAAHGIDQLFTAMLFSDEIGVSKPHPRIFEAALRALGTDASRAVHIGDIERTDIAGANDKGMRAILFRGDSSGRYHHENGAENTNADAVAHSWREVIEILEGWGMKNHERRTKIEE
ncbi:MAG: HAD family hydrolase [Bacteroidetes bacterium]|nr:HAD family hydrolase [Bacteroidota bacterium]